MGSGPAAYCHSVSLLPRRRFQRKIALKPFFRCNAGGGDREGSVSLGALKGYIQTLPDIRLHCGAHSPSRLLICNQLDTICVFVSTRSRLQIAAQLTKQKVCPDMTQAPSRPRRAPSAFPARGKTGFGDIVEIAVEGENRARSVPAGQARDILVDHPLGQGHQIGIGDRCQFRRQIS
jgi:hypothetical protein